MRAKLTSATTLHLSFPNNGPSGGTVQWQVVEYTNSNVQTGDVSIRNTTDTTKTVTLGASVDPARSLLIFSNDLNVPNSHAMPPSTSGFTGSVVDANTLTFARGRGQRRQHRYPHLVPGGVHRRDDGSVRLGIVRDDGCLGSRHARRSRRTSRSIATLVGRSGRGGLSNTSNTNVGADNFTATLSSTGITVTRGTTNATSTANWSVLEFQ